MDLIQLIAARIEFASEEWLESHMAPRFYQNMTPDQQRRVREGMVEGRSVGTYFKTAGGATVASSRVAKPSDVVKEGQIVKVKLLGFDDRGKVRLSMRLIDQTTGEDLEAKERLEQQEAGE